ncbi:hypothetical protein [Bradyrhizobium sp.]|uniref:hypothetical protein n=1 Tax=Bradyrhizobium sp. TaxID=376 RepID=UPI003C768D61
MAILQTVEIPRIIGEVDSSARDARAAFDAAHFGTGWLWRRFMARVLATLATRLASAAERQVTAS